MLPPGTIKALKGHRDAIVTVACFAACLTAIVCGVPAWSAVVALAMALTVSHVRACAAERHVEALERRQLLDAVAKVIALDELNARPQSPVVRKARSGFRDEDSIKGLYR